MPTRHTRLAGGICFDQLCLLLPLYNRAVVRVTHRLAVTVGLWGGRGLGKDGLDGGNIAVAGGVVREAAAFVGPEDLYGVQKARLAGLAMVPEGVAHVFGLPMGGDANELTGVALEQILRDVGFVKAAASCDLLAHAMNDLNHQVGLETEDNDLGMLEGLHHPDGIDEARSFVVVGDDDEMPAVALDVVDDMLLDLGVHGGSPVTALDVHDMDIGVEVKC